jgi:hypothetical protein
MPRGAVLDVPGSLHHVIIRGSNRSAINFLLRLFSTGWSLGGDDVSQGGEEVYETVIDISREG